MQQSRLMNRYSFLGLNNPEFLFFETFGCLPDKIKIKLNLCHYRDMFVVLVMLKYIADNYAYTSVQDMQFTDKYNTD